MNAVFYVIGVLLVLIIVELLILIIETVKLSSALQNFLLGRNSEPRETPDTRSLASLFSQLTDLRNKNEKSDESAADTGHPAASAGRDVNEYPEDYESSMQASGAEEASYEGREASGSSSTVAEESASGSSVQRKSASPSGGSTSETKTAVSSFSVLKCPSCGRENSSFRKTCYFCETPLQKGSS